MPKLGKAQAKLLLKAILLGASTSFLTFQLVWWAEEGLGNVINLWVDTFTNAFIGMLIFVPVSLAVPLVPMCVLAATECKKALWLTSILGTAFFATWVARWLAMIASV